MDSKSHHDDNQAYRFPVSVKGVLFIDGKVVLLKNERDEWGLPGGKLEVGESLEECVGREIEEELGVKSSTVKILDTWVYHIRECVNVLIVTFGCPPLNSTRVTHSPEHKAVGRFSIEEMEKLRMPEGYKRSIRAWAGKMDVKATGS
jgi:8-oxo-dGTP pyrophosphatase MutT (NUDIX family)